MIILLSVVLVICAIFMLVGFGVETSIPFAMGFIGLLIGVPLLFFLLHQQNKAEHEQIYGDLVTEGWKIDSNDVHELSDKVDIDCITLKVKKLGGRYYVVKPRDDKLGGGYNVVLAADQSLISEVCK